MPRVARGLINIKTEKATELVKLDELAIISLLATY